MATDDRAVASGRPSGEGDRSDTATRSGPLGGRGLRNRSVAASTSTARATSATVLAIAPCTEQPNQCSVSPPGNGTIPRLGLNPTTPQFAAGIRSEPPPSDPCAMGTIPAATAAAPPPVEPPALRSGSYGLRVPPRVADSVKSQIASSGWRVLPTTIAPASVNRRTSRSSLSRGCGLDAAEPY